MGGITSNIGLFSGIDTGGLIEQLLSIQSRPQILAQQRIIQLQTQQAAFLDVNSRLNTLKTAAGAFRTENIFDGKSAVSSNEDVLTASAGIGALSGSYNFIVDRLVSTQQMLTRGFADADSSAIGLDSLTFEGAEARLDRETALADFNNGDGISRGKILVNGTEVDLSRVGTVDELLNEINSTVSGVNAYADNDHIVIEGVTSLQDGVGYSVLESLGLSSYTGVAADITGTGVYGLDTNTALSSLNDGRGVSIRNTFGAGVADFNIVVAGDTVGVRIGEIQNEDLETIDGEVSSVAGVVERINTALSDAGYADITASINASTGAIDITDTTGGRTVDIADITVGETTYTTATDLGIAGSLSGGSLGGERIFAGLNTTLVSSLNGGSGLNGASSSLSITTRDGAISLLDLSGAQDFNDIINTINSSSSGRLTASLNESGNGLQITDNTAGGSTFSIASNDTSTALGIDGSFTSGIASGTNLQLAYLGRASSVSDLNNGQGIGTGSFDIVDSNGVRTTIDISSSDDTLGAIIDAINSGGSSIVDLAINARINDTGDGIVIEETGTPGGAAIQITDTDGTVASRLNIAGTATGTDPENFIDGSFETTVTFEAGATLNDIVTAVNDEGIGVTLSVVNTGTGTAPYRLNIASSESGTSGRFTIDSSGFDLGLSTLDEGNDAQIFFGSTDPARGVLLSSSTNQFDSIIQGATIDIKSTSDTPVTLSITNDTETIENKISDFVSAFNDAISNIDFQTRFDSETEVRGTLLGDGTVNQLRNGLFNVFRQPNEGFTTTFDRLVEAGIRVAAGGQIEFDKDKFREAYNQDPAAVEDLFTKRVLENTDDGDENTDDEIVLSEIGAMVRIEEFVDRYVNSISGILQNQNTSLQNQIDSQNDRIDLLQDRLDSQRAILERQFLAMEQAIAASQNQSGSLAQIAALG